MNRKTTVKTIKRELLRARRPKPWWCPAWLHRLAVHLVFDTSKMGESP